MRLQWTRAALSGLTRLHAFLAPGNQPAAARPVQALAQAPARSPANPRLGEQLFEFAPREVRRLLVGQYELRLWHTREHRQATARRPSHEAGTCRGTPSTSPGPTGARRR